MSLYIRDHAHFFPCIHKWHQLCLTSTIAICAALYISDCYLCVFIHQRPCTLVSLHTSVTPVVSHINDRHLCRFILQWPLFVLVHTSATALCAFLYINGRHLCLCIHQRPPSVLVYTLVVAICASLYTSDPHLCLLIHLWSPYVLLYTSATAIFIDKGDPYKLGPLMVGQLTLSKTLQGAPLHTIGNDWCFAVLCCVALYSVALCHIMHVCVCVCVRARTPLCVSVRACVCERLRTWLIDWLIDRLIDWLIDWLGQTLQLYGSQT